MKLASYLYSCHKSATPNRHNSINIHYHYHHISVIFHCHYHHISIYSITILNMQFIRDDLFISIIFHYYCEQINRYVILFIASIVVNSIYYTPSLIPNEYAIHMLYADFNLYPNSNWLGYLFIRVQGLIIPYSLTNTIHTYGLNTLFIRIICCPQKNNISIFNKIHIYICNTISCIITLIIHHLLQ